MPHCNNTVPLYYCIVVYCVTATGSQVFLGINKKYIHPSSYQPSIGDLHNCIYSTYKCLQNNSNADQDGHRTFR